jgi:hypothetical protein
MDYKKSHVFMYVKRAKDDAGKNVIAELQILFKNIREKLLFVLYHIPLLLLRCQLHVTNGS